MKRCDHGHGQSDNCPHQTRSEWTKAQLRTKGRIEGKIKREPVKQQGIIAMGGMRLARSTWINLGGDQGLQSCSHKDQTGDHEKMRTIVAEEGDARTAAVVGSGHPVFGPLVVAVEITPPESADQSDGEKEAREVSGAVRQDGKSTACGDDNLAQHDDQQQTVPFDKVPDIEREAFTGIQDADQT